MSDDIVFLMTAPNEPQLTEFRNKVNGNDELINSRVMFSARVSSAKYRGHRMEYSARNPLDEHGIPSAEAKDGSLLPQRQ